MRSVTLVDAEYLRKEAQKVLRREHTSLVARELTGWLRKEDPMQPVRWYDAHYKANHPQANNRRMFFKHMALEASVKLRMGTLVERSNAPVDRALQKVMPSIAKDLGVPVKSLVDAFAKHWVSHSISQQKGVDALLIMDMIDLASYGRYDTILLCAGDTDFLPVINRAQQMGVMIHLIVPRPESVSDTFWADVDTIIEIPTNVLEKTFPERVHKS